MREAKTKLKGMLRVAALAFSPLLLAVGTARAADPVPANPPAATDNTDDRVEKKVADTKAATTEVRTSSAAGGSDVGSTLSPEEYEPPKPPTAAEIEAAGTPEEAYQLLQRDFDYYLKIADSFRNDIKDLVKVRYAEERERITGQYERNIQQIEVEERQRRLEAIARFEEFLGKYPNDPFYSPDAMFRLAELYFEKSSDEYLVRTKGYEDQLHAYERGELASEPEAPKPNLDKTVALYRDLLSRFTDYRHADAARYLLGYSLEEMDKKDDALQVYTELVQKNPKSRFMAEVWTRIGEIYFDENKKDSLEKAADAYKQVLAFKDSPYYDKALYKLAWTYYRMDKFAEAVDGFIQLVDYSDEQKKLTGKTGSELRAEAIQYIAVSLSDDKWGGVDKANSILGGKLSSKDYTGEIWKRFGEILFDQTRYPIAIEVFNIGLNKYPNNPQNPEVQSNIITAYERIRDFDNATKAREVLTEKYSEGSPWYAANKDNKDALGKARDLTEKSLYTAAIFHHQQAQAYKKAGRTADARASYQRASQNYNNYLARFPLSKNSYDFNFFLAECMYYSDDYLGSAAQYEKVRDSNADNRHLNDAALSAVIAFEKEIEREEASNKLPKEELLIAKQRKDKPVKPTDIPELRMKLIKASDRLLTLIPDNERAPAVAYRAAETFYKHDQFDEARKRFEKVIIAYPATDVARYATNLIIESYLATEDWDNVKKWADRASEIARGVTPKDPKEQENRKSFLENLENFKVGAQFKKAEKLEKDGDFEGAANMYVQLVDESPSHQFADKALFNAAINYEKVKRFDTASKVYQRIYDNYPQSELADRALFRVGVNYEKGFDFTSAISAYTKLVEQYPNSKHRADALYNVAVTLENMQQYGQSAAAFKRYATTFPDRDDAGDVFFRSATVYEKMSSWPEEIDTLGAFIKKYGTNQKQKEHIVEAYKRMADAQLKQKQGPKAVASYQDCVKEFDRRHLKTDDRAASFAAQCSFELAEDVFRKYDAMKIEGAGKKQAKTLADKATLQRQIEKMYTDVFKYKRAETTLAALYEIGHSYERFAESMYNAEIPPEFKGKQEVIDEYKQQLETKAQVLEHKAEFAYRKANEEAIKTRVTNEWSQKILEGLNKYQPEEFPVQKAGKSSLQTFTISGNGLDTMEPPKEAPKEPEKPATPNAGGPDTAPKTANAGGK